MMYNEDEEEQEGKILVKFPDPSKMVNKVFLPIFKDYRYYVLWGGRQAGKSHAIARKLVQMCLEENYFKCILIRNTYATIRESNFEEIVKAINAMKLQDLFKITYSPLSIKCINGNQFNARGCDDVAKIRSVVDPTCVFYEECSQIEDIETFLTISSSLRSNKTKKFQEYISFNPEFSVSYEDSWLYKMFFLKNIGEKSFENNLSVKLPNGKIFDSKFIVIHSTYHDNPHCQPELVATLENFKIQSPHLYQTLALGNFSYRIVSNKFWKGFDVETHVKEIEFEKNDVVHVSFDENNQPYPALTIWQTDDKEIKQLHEICLRSPRNKLTEVAKEIKNYLHDNNWEGSRIYLYGDASSAKESVLLKAGVNYYTLMQAELEKDFNVRVVKSKKNPGVAISADFINSLYSTKFDGYSISINKTCKESINDYVMLQETNEGKMLKVKDSNGIERYGHISDSKKYFLIEYCKESFNKYKGRLSGKIEPVFFTYEQQQAESPFYY